MNNTLAGKKILIVGGSSGIGLARVRVRGLKIVAEYAGKIQCHAEYGQAQKTGYQKGDISIFHNFRILQYICFAEGLG
jgi:hypothetical protein